MARSVSPDKIIPRWLWVDGENWFLNSQKTGELFEVSNQTLLNWDQSTGGVLKNSYGWWDVKKIYEFLKNSETSDAARKLKAEADLKVEQVKAAKFENEVEAEKYFAKVEVENEWSRRVVEVKGSLQAMARKIVGRISDPDLRILVEQIIGEEVYEYLSQYARTGQYTPNKAKRVPKAPLKKRKKVKR